MQLYDCILTVADQSAINSAFIFNQIRTPHGCHMMTSCVNTPDEPPSVTVLHCTGSADNRRVTSQHGHLRTAVVSVGRVLADSPCVSRTATRQVARSLAAIRSIVVQPNPARMHLTRTQYVCSIIHIRHKNSKVTKFRKNK